MTPQEFKAWFEGFTEAFSGVPTKAQWARIKERVVEIDGKPVTERVFVDRYWPRYAWQGPYPYFTTTGGVSNYTISGVSNNNAPSFHSTTAMYALGQADAGSIGAP